MTGRLAIFRMACISSMPSDPGRTRSSSASWGRSCSMRRTASSGSPVTRGVYPEWTRTSRT